MLPQKKLYLLTPIHNIIDFYNRIKEGDITAQKVRAFLEQEGKNLKPETRIITIV